MSKQVGDRQHRFKQRKALCNRRNDNSPVPSGGENGEWTPHDRRRTGAAPAQIAREAQAAGVQTTMQPYLIALTSDA